MKIKTYTESLCDGLEEAFHSLDRQVSKSLADSVTIESVQDSVYVVQDPSPDGKFRGYVLNDTLVRVIVYSAKEGSPTIPENVLETPIDEFGLGKRAERCLANGNIRTLKDLLDKEKSDLLKLKGMGSLTYSKVQRLQEKYEQY